MEYVLRKVNEADEEFFINSGIRNPFGGRPGFAYYMVENQEQNVKMIFIGGQGNMKEDGKEYSEMAAYAAVVWNGKSYLVEYYSHSKCVNKSGEYEVFWIIYKIKAVYAFFCSDDEKKKFIEIVKKCFEAYGNEGMKRVICEKVLFIDEEVRWG